MPAKRGVNGHAWLAACVLCSAPALILKGLDAGFIAGGPVGGAPRMT